MTNHEIAGLVEQAHGLGRAGDPFKLVGPVGIAVVDIEHAVAIEKRRRTLALVAAQEFQLRLSQGANLAI